MDLKTYENLPSLSFAGDLCPDEFKSMIANLKVETQSERLNKSVVDDLCRLYQTRGDGASALYKKYFGEHFSGAAYLRWMMSRLNSIAEGTSLEMANAYVLPDQPHRIFLTSGFVFEGAGSSRMRKRNWIERISTIVHEAKHLEPLRSYREKIAGGELAEIDRSADHVRCSEASESREDRCDREINSSWAIEIVFLQNLIRFCDKGCTQSDKKDAESRLQSLLEEGFLENPAREAMLADAKSD